MYLVSLCNAVTYDRLLSWQSLEVHRKSYSAARDAVCDMCGKLLGRMMTGISRGITRTAYCVVRGKEFSVPLVTVTTYNKTF